MNATDAYDECIEAAVHAAERQNKAAQDAGDTIMRELHSTAAITLEGFADLLRGMKAIRCP